MNLAAPLEVSQKKYIKIFLKKMKFLCTASWWKFLKSWLDPCNQGKKEMLSFRIEKNVPRFVRYWPRGKMDWAQHIYPPNFVGGIDSIDINTFPLHIKVCPWWFVIYIYINVWLLNQNLLKQKFDGGETSCSFPINAKMIIGRLFQNFSVWSFKILGFKISFNYNANQCVVFFL